MRKYDSYKESGVEWIGKIPNGWKKSKVKYHFHLISGFPFSSEDITNEEREYPIIRIGNVTSGKIDVYFEGKLSDKHPLVNYGDYVVSLTGDFSIRKWENKTSLLNQRCGLIRKFTSDDERFLFYYLPFQFRILEKTKYFTTLKNLSNGELLDIEFILPPLSEQQKIVSFLDTKTSLIDSLIEKTQRKIELLKEKRTSLINEVVTKGLNPDVEMKDSGVEWIGEIPSHWTRNKLNRISERIGDGLHSTPKYVDSSEYYFINGNNLVNGEIKIFDSTKCVSEEEFKKHFIQLNKKTLLLSINGTIGNLSFYNDEKVILGKSSCYINLRENTNHHFIYYVLKSESISKYFTFELTGTTIFNLSLNSIRNTPIVVPPENEQQQIVEYLDEQTQLIDKTISIEEKRIELLKEYRQSLISEVVTGKRKVVE